MDLKIEDYLPFYIGCPILICVPGEAPIYHYELEGFDKAGNRAIAERAHYIPEHIKPILYKIDDGGFRIPSSMPTTAAIEVYKEGKGKKITYHPFAELTKDLIKQHVDLFGLIDAGLAIWIKEIHRHVPGYTRVEVSAGPRVYNHKKEFGF